MTFNNNLTTRPNSLFTLSFITILVVSILLVSSCSDDSKLKHGKGKAGAQAFDKRSKNKKSGKVIPVAIKLPRTGLAASYYVTTATLEPSSNAKINSRANGIVKILFHEEGDDVIEGEPLLKLEDDEQRLRLKQAQQKLASARREFQRLNKMKKAGVVSPTEWETADNAYKTAETEEALAELTLSYTEVSAPFSGRVVWREVDLGEHVAPGELLYRMMAIEPLLVRVHIPSNRIGQVAKGQSVEIILDHTEKPLIGKIHLVSPIVDPDTGTLKVTIQLTEYPHNVRPGDFSEIHMITDQHSNALLVPSTSIIEERGQNFVYLVDKGKAIKTKVSVGFAMATETEIVSGIKKDDQVVIKGQRSLNDNVNVEVLTEASEKKGDLKRGKNKQNKKQRGNKKRERDS